jgi:hypothetical protein
MTLEEATRIANNRTAEEPAEDWLTSWQAARPQPEPAREPRKLDTAQIDVAAVIRQALKAERGLMTEATGGAIGEIRNEIRDEFEAEVARLRAELDQLRHEFSQANELRELRAELREIREMLTRKPRVAKTPPSLQLPGPANGDARSQPQ